MTELENRIYKFAMEILPEAEEKVKEIKTKARYINVHFCCYGCFDTLVYDTKLRLFTKIKYKKGVGAGTRLGFMNKFSAYFDEVESFEIILN